MKHHNFSLEDALHDFLLEDDPEGPPAPTGWLHGPALPEYEAHVQGTKPFTAEQMAWVKSHPACQRTLAMFEQHLGVVAQPAVPVTLAAGLPEGVSSQIGWVESQGAGEISVDFGRAALAGTLVFLQRVGRGLARVLRLDSQGKGRFTSLPAGEYRVVPSFSSGVLYGLMIAGGFAEADAPGRVPPLVMEQERDLEHGLHASVRVFGTEAEIVFTTSNADLEGATIHIGFTRPETGEVQLSGTVALEKHSKPPDRWVGSWQYPFQSAGRLEIVFAVEKKQ